MPDDDLNLFSTEAQAPDDGKPKAKLDDTELGPEPPKAIQKVELDLDDAPFLEEEEEESPAEGQEEATLFEAPEEVVAPLPWWKKKKIMLLAAIGLFVLLGAGAGAYFFLLKPAQPPVVEEAPAEPLPPVVEEKPAPPEPPEIKLRMDPFMVEMTDDKGRDRLLTVSIHFITRNPRLANEVRMKTIVLRDALFYFLKNKTFLYLTDKKSAVTLRKEVLMVANQFLTEDQLDGLTLDEYYNK